MDTKKIYQRRFEDKGQREMIWKILVKDFFQKYVDKKDSVIDVACGYGEFINNLRCRKKIAVDINSDSRKNVSAEVEFHAGSSTNLGFIKNNSVDKIFVSNFFEHITKEQTILTVKEFKRILKKKGQVLILQPNIRFLTSDFWMFFDHVTPIDDRALEELFLTQDFFLKKRVLKFLPFTTKSSLPKSSFLIKLYLRLPLLWLIFGKQSFLIFEKRPEI